MLGFFKNQIFKKQIKKINQNEQNQTVNITIINKTITKPNILIRKEGKNSFFYQNQKLGIL